MKALKIPQATKEGFILCPEGGVFDISYPSSKVRRGRVQGGGSLIPSLTAAGSELLIYIEKIMERNDKTRVLESSNEANTRKVLCLLRKEVGEETFLSQMGRLRSILEKEVLRQGMYEKGISKAGTDESNQKGSSSHIDANDATPSFGSPRVPEMQVNKEPGCPSQGRELQEQYNRELDAVMQKLSYEGTPSESILHDLRRACERPQSLLETLSEMEEVWKTYNNRPNGKGWVLDWQNMKWFRIRKLTVREAFRLMDVKESDIDKLMATQINKKGVEEQIISNSQLYKCAGNSIVVNPMFLCFKNLFMAEKVEASIGDQLSLF